MRSQKIKKIIGASRLKKGILSHKLLSLKYFWTCQKKINNRVKLTTHFSLEDKIVKNIFVFVEVSSQDCNFVTLKSFLRFYELD